MSFKLRKITHKTLSGFMAIWLSGVVFLLCCETINGMSMEAEFCPLAKMSADCDKANKSEDSQVVTTQTGEQGMDCCAFLPMFFDKTRTIETDRQIASVVPVAVVEEPRLIYAQKSFAFTRSYQSTVLLRNRTFLKNRTLRI